MQKKINPSHVKQKDTSSFRLYHFFPLVLIVCSIFLIDASLPLRGLWFYDALLRTPLDSWLLGPTHLLFPGKPTVVFQTGIHVIQSGPLSIAWKETGALFASFVLAFFFYLLGLRHLPRYVGMRYILLSTVLIGLLLTLVPVVTSQDVFSYIGYARLGAMYHLNPLTALPIALQNDPIEARIYWLHQPSAYGPTWAILTSALQSFALLLGFKQTQAMVMLLRFFSLAMHLGSTYLIWSISGHLTAPSPLTQRKRLYATLAFAWNPFLLLEASINAHNDTTILFLVLFAIWVLVRYPATLRTYMQAAFLLAIAACLKITLLIIIPGLFLFLWAQTPRRWLTMLATGATYVGTMVLMYAPFWQNGQVLHVFFINPGSTHEINTIYEFVLRLYSSLRGAYIAPATLPQGSHIENVLHAFTTGSVFLAYAILFLIALFPLYRVKTIPDMIRWMALAWLFYIMLGSPWFWPWYTISLFGLYALLEATAVKKQLFLGILDIPVAMRMLAFSMITLYCWLAIAPFKSYIPHLKNFQWSYVRGLWIWIPIILAVRLSYLRPSLQTPALQTQPPPSSETELEKVVL